MLNYSLITENGWPKCDPSDCTWVTVPGTSVNIQIRSGAPALVLGAWVAWFNKNVEPVRDHDTACYTPTNSVWNSNHLSGTAVDINWQLHPFHEYTFDSAKIARIRDGQRLFRNCIWWGADWNSPHDEMHFQLNFGENDSRITDLAKDLQDGYLDIYPADPRGKYVQAIILEGQRRGISPRGIKIALATALVESNLKMYANSSVPQSFSMPHDAVGSDYDSVGLFQQRCPMWGPVEILMDPTQSAGLFYDHLVKLDYDNEDNSPGYYAQSVQRSAFPARYDTRYSEATDLYNRYVTAATISEDDMASVPQGEWDEIRDKTRQIWGALFNAVPSNSRYGDPKDLWPTKDFIRNDDGFLFDLITEHDASLGDPAALARVQKAAAAGDLIALHFLEKLNTPPEVVPITYSEPVVAEDVSPPPNNMVCWNCGKHYPEELPSCPFCGASQEQPEQTGKHAAAQQDSTYNVPSGLPTVDKKVVDQFLLLHHFKDELPEEVSKAVEDLTPIIKGLVQGGHDE